MIDFKATLRPKKHHTQSWFFAYSMAEPIRHRIGYADGLKLATSLCLCYTLLVAGVRAWLRRSIFGVDDIVISVSTIICLGHFATNYALLSFGFGDSWEWQSISTSDLGSLNQASLASVATFALTLYTSKAAVITFLARISQQKQHAIVNWSCLGIVVATGFASVLLVLVGWPLDSGFYFAFKMNSRSCKIETTRWVVFTALDLFTEVLLLALPCHLLWGIQMQPKEKLKILAAFYVRLPVIGLSVVRYVYTQRLCKASGDIGKESALVLIFLEVEASYAVVSSTLSTLKTFTSNFNSSFGFGFTQQAGPDDYALTYVRKYGKGSTTNSRNDQSPAPLHNNSTKSQTVTQEKEVQSHSRTVSLLSGDHGKSFTQIRANPAASTYNESQWQDNASDGSQECNLDHGIMRQTEYSVRHSDLNDERPILKKFDSQVGVRFDQERYMSH